jgi:hypothetical protein
MMKYEEKQTYRIVAAGGGVRVLMPGGFASTTLMECYPDASKAAVAIADAIKDGMPALEVVDEMVCVPVARVSKGSNTDGAR